jgi:hypothetical protein
LVVASQHFILVGGVAASRRISFIIAWLGVSVKAGFPPKNPEAPKAPNKENAP